MFKRFIIATVLTALMALSVTSLVVPASSGARQTPCDSVTKKYQSWTTYSKNRKVGDPKAKMARNRGTKGHVKIEAPSKPARSGRYHIRVMPQPVCEIVKVRVKTRRGATKTVKISRLGGTISFRAQRGSPFPYREVRVWTQSSREARGFPGDPGLNVNCGDDQLAKVVLNTSSGERFGDRDDIEVTVVGRGDTTTDLSWSTTSGRVVMKRVVERGMGWDKGPVAKRFRLLPTDPSGGEGTATQQGDETVWVDFYACVRQ